MGWYSTDERCPGWSVCQCPPNVFPPEAERAAAAERVRVKREIRRHLRDEHGLTPLQMSPEALHAQDHLPGHGYNGHGWTHGES